jgi:hypothetical protein
MASDDKHVQTMVLLLYLVIATQRRRNTAAQDVGISRRFATTNFSTSSSSSTVNVKQSKKQFFSNLMPAGTRTDEKNV